MTYLVLKFLHVGSMFAATALAVGPIVVLVLVLRSRDAAAIRGVFSRFRPIARAGGAAYGLGIVFGVATAVEGSIPLATPWLIEAYVLLGGLIVANLAAERWIEAVTDAAAVGDEATLDAYAHSLRPIVALVGAGTVTLALVFVMVVKPGPP